MKQPSHRRDHTLIGIQDQRPCGIIDIPGRWVAPQLPFPGLVQFGILETQPQGMELRVTPGPLKSSQNEIVKGIRIIDPILIHDQWIGQGTNSHALLPIGLGTG